MLSYCSTKTKGKNQGGVLAWFYSQNSCLYSEKAAVTEEFRKLWYKKKETESKTLEK